MYEYQNGALSKRVKAPRPVVQKLLDSRIRIHENVKKHVCITQQKIDFINTATANPLMSISTHLYEKNNVNPINYTSIIKISNVTFSRSIDVESFESRDGFRTSCGRVEAHCLKTDLSFPHFLRFHLLFDRQTLEPIIITQEPPWKFHIFNFPINKLGPDRTTRFSDTKRFRLSFFLRFQIFLIYVYQFQHKQSQKSLGKIKLIFLSQTLYFNYMINF